MEPIRGRRWEGDAELGGRILPALRQDGKPFDGAGEGTATERMAVIFHGVATTGASR